MVFDDVLLLPKPCSTRKAPRRSDGLSPRGTCTTPESLSPAEGKVTACSVMGVALHRACPGSSAARSAAKWCDADTDLGFTRDRQPNVRKSGKPDLRRPSRSVAVPDQRCTASR